MLKSLCPSSKENGISPMEDDELICLVAARFQGGLLPSQDALDPPFPLQEVHVERCNKIQCSFKTNQETIPYIKNK